VRIKTVSAALITSTVPLTVINPGRETIKPNFDVIVLEREVDLKVPSDSSYFNQTLPKNSSLSKFWSS